MCFGYGGMKIVRVIEIASAHVFRSSLERNRNNFNINLIVELVGCKTPI